MTKSVTISRWIRVFSMSILGSTAFDGAIAQSPRNLDLVLKPHMVDGRMDYVGVTMRLHSVDVRAGSPLLNMYMITAGVPSDRYDASDLTVTDASGAVQLIQNDDPVDPANNRYLRRWTTTRRVNGDLVVALRGMPTPPNQYRGGPVMDMRAEDGGMNGRGGHFLVFPDDSASYRVQVRWDLSGMPSGSRGVWTHGEGDASAVLTPETLGGTIFMAGPVKSYPTPSNGTFSIYWQTQPNWDVNEIAPVLQKIYQYYGRLFDDTAHTMRIFMRRGRSNGGSGDGGSFLMNTPSADLNLPATNVPALIAFLSHEMLHQFPEEFDDVNIGEPTYWWSEGIATYYSNLIVYRLGLKNLDQFLADWNGFLRNYYADPNRLLSYKEIGGNMFGPVGLNLMYGKGQAFMMLLNARIREKSGGARSLDDLAFPLIHQHRHGGSYTRADFLAALDRELGPQGRVDYDAFRAGGKLLDLPPNLMGPCFRRESVVYRPFALGFDARAATSGERRTIRNLVHASSAERAGVREGDEVVSTLQLDVIRADTNATLTLELRRDGAPLTATYAPRLDPMDGYRWVRDPSVPESACKL